MKISVVIYQFNGQNQAIRNKDFAQTKIKKHICRNRDINGVLFIVVHILTQTTLTVIYPIIIYKMFTCKIT